ncbi:MAG: hypothetical protein CMB80_08375 [Flammeovirgaceae bacterium]|nr:hypothetical protein [Flammeovirgaceae bacterium]MBR06335.1 hypothetical protein [Rickettsiales bacterium]HCX22031.1 hypothetical protein [Cytophagales bacterium]
MLLRSTLTNRESVYKTSKMEITSLNDRILKVELKGFQTIAEASRNGIMMKEAIYSRGIQLLLIDERELKAVSDEMKQFFKRSIDEIANSDIKKIAILSADNIIARFGMEQVITETENRINYERRIFESEIEALGWLES